MKTNFFLLVAVLSLAVKGQENKNKPSVKWENGNVTLFEDIGTVWIIRKEASIIRNARLWEIQSEKGKIVYEKENCLHDLNIADISAISTGRDSFHLMYFDTLNKPYIARCAGYFYNSDYTDFKVSSKRTETKTFSGNSAVMDTVVTSHGEVVPVKIISITGSTISFKKADLLNGPVYNMNTDSSTKIIKHQNSTKVVFKNK